MKCKTPVMSCKKKHLCFSVCTQDGSKEEGQTHSDSLPEDLQKFTMVSAYVRYVRC